MSERVDKAIFKRYSANHPVTLEYMLMKQRIAELEAGIRNGDVLMERDEKRIAELETQVQIKHDRITELEAQLNIIRNLAQMVEAKYNALVDGINSEIEKYNMSQDVCAYDCLAEIHELLPEQEVGDVTD